MIKKTWLIVVLIMITIPLVGGCMGRANGIKPLTDSEKERMVEIALETDEAVEILAEESDYKVEFRWLVIGRLDPVYGAIMKEVFSSDDLDSDRFRRWLGRWSLIYPAVLLRFGKPEQKQLRVAIDRETESVVFVERLIVVEGREFPSSVGEPLIVMNTSTTMAGVGRLVTISEEGHLTYIEDRGLRHPSPGNEALRITKARELGENELANLLSLFEQCEFDASGRCEALTSVIDTDAYCELSVNYPGETKTIVANYQPLFHDLTELEDVPDSVRRLFRELEYIVEHKVREEKRELIAAE
jgi:hypothetical protein